MNSKYKSWINNYKGETRRKCVEVTKEMKQIFPELNIVRGLVEVIESDKLQQHCWLEDEQGSTIDPTSNQWLGIISYKPIREGDPYPVGKCINCNKFIFSNQNTSPFCSNRCRTEERFSRCNR